MTEIVVELTWPDGTKREYTVTEYCLLATEVLAQTKARLIERKVSS